MANTKSKRASPDNIAGLTDISKEQAQNRRRARACDESGGNAHQRAPTKPPRRAPCPDSVIKAGIVNTPSIASPRRRSRHRRAEDPWAIASFGRRPSRAVPATAPRAA
jgi:hypothetical protein